MLKKRSAAAELLLITLIFFAGCTYISKTDIFINAQEVEYPLGIRTLKLINGTLNLHREMNAEGITNGK